ncbi:MAG: UDP-N-acetylmuramate dehydrogenase [Acidimicrobiales bacterium]|jgi:UDP-N-acetylmuramate dehydrogenase
MSLERLLAVAQGRAVEHAPFGARTTYRVGGTVRALVTLSTKRDLEELGPLIAECGLEPYVLGNGSNLLVADAEQDVLGVHLDGEFAQLTWRDEHGRVLVLAGAGLDLPVAARRLASEGVVGFEWAVGVPGSFGGAAVMNAGGHGSDMAASVRQVATWRDGATRTWSVSDLDFAYRSSALGEGDVVTEVTLELARGDAEAARREISEIVRWRREHQPGGANGGSVFKNPVGDHAGRLIEEAGAKGLRHGSAVVSDKHANFILVDAHGRADDVFALMGEVRRRVQEHSGVRLESEHRLLGFKERP